MMEDDNLGVFEEVPQDEYDALSQSQPLSSESEYDPWKDSDQTSQDTDSKVRF